MHGVAQPGLYNGLGLLDNELVQFTDVLQEYFLPPRLAGFLADSRAELRGTTPAAQRIDPFGGEGGHAARYAPGHRLSVVLYLSQRVSPEGPTPTWPT